MCGNCAGVVIFEDTVVCVDCGQQPQQQLLSAHCCGAVTAYLSSSEFFQDSAPSQYPPKFMYLTLVSSR